LTGAQQVLEEPGTGRVGKHVAPPEPVCEMVEVFVSEVVNCGHFWVQYFAEDNQRSLAEVENFLNRNNGSHLQVSGRLLCS